MKNCECGRTLTVADIGGKCEQCRVRPVKKERQSDGESFWGKDVSPTRKKLLTYALLGSMFRGKQ